MKKFLRPLLAYIDSFVVFTGEIFDTILSIVLDIVVTILNLAIVLTALGLFLLLSFTQLLTNNNNNED